MRSDAEIFEQVLEEIRRDPQLAKIAPTIGVFVKDEVVTLTGTVDYYSQRLAAESAAQRTSGVKVVAVDIDVRGSQGSDAISDTMIASAIRDALTWHSAVNEDQIDIKVDNGWVYLDGSVHWDYEKMAAERVIENLKGVKGIINKIRVQGNDTTATEIKKRIDEAFHRIATIDAASISVVVNGGQVELRGNVRSGMERKQAEQVAMSMPGISGVKNKLKVQEENALTLN